MKIKLQNLSLLILASIWLVPQTSCVPEDDLQNIVVTEDVLFISGEKVRLTGRVIETTGNVDDHGFHISTNENFTSPIIVSLGQKENGLGRFIGSYELLAIGSAYYYRSYANIAGDEVVGVAKQFNSLRPRIDSFSPNNGVAGTVITITGVNFTNDLSVFIDDRKVSVISVENESVIKVKSPELLDNSEVDIKVGIQDTVMTFSEKFTYHFGRWRLETKFPNDLQLYESMYFREGNEFFIGLGWTGETLYSNIWSLNLDTYAWTDLNFNNDVASTRSPFSAGGYWGTGLIGTRFNSSQSPYFWQYSTGIFELKPFLTFRLYKSIGLKLASDLFVFGGTLLDDSNNTIIYKFQELNNSWSVAGDAPIHLSSDYPAFVYNNEAYFLLADGSITKYDPVSGTWEEAGQYPSNARTNGAAVVIGSKVYIGLFEVDNRIWEWDLITKEWLKKSDFTGIVQDINNGYFEYNNKAYFFRSSPNSGKFEPDPIMELWSFDPTKLK